jgi:hypothetical protein
MSQAYRVFAVAADSHPWVTYAMGVSDYTLGERLRFW